MACGIVLTIEELKKTSGTVRIDDDGGDYRFFDLNFPTTGLQVNDPCCFDIDFRLKDPVASNLQPIASNEEIIDTPVIGDQTIGNGETLKIKDGGEVTGQITNNGGKGALTLDGLSTNGQVYCSKFATLTLDLSMHTSANDLELSFDYIQHGEESHLDDRIWIRGDSNNVWIEIYDWFANRQPDGVLKQVTGIDIDSFLQTNGQVPTNSFQLIFGQHDNSYAENVSAKDGVTFDNIFIVNASMVPFSKPEDELALLPVIYPNPVLNEITIRGIDQGKLKLVDPLGHSLLEKSINSATTIDISAIKKGVYFSTLEYDNLILIRKIVKR